MKHLFLCLLPVIALAMTVMPTVTAQNRGDNRHLIPHCTTNCDGGGKLCKYCTWVETPHWGWVFICIQAPCP